MSRSGYNDESDPWPLICWRGAVASAMRGRRGQAFLRELLNALDGLPQKRLVSFELERDGDVCAIGAVGRTRGVPMGEIDPEDHEQVAGTFDIAHAMACEIMWINDEGRWGWNETPETRFKRVREWVAKELRVE